MMTARIDIDAPAVTVHVPTALRRFSAQQATIAVAANTVGEALETVGAQYPRLRSQIFASDGRLRRFINVFVNTRDIRHLDREATRLQPADTITLLAAIAGG
jgi:molybdopterin converting factor small subunit